MKTIRNEILKKFLGKDIFNPITLKSIQEKLIQANELDVISYQRQRQVSWFLKDE